jgi:hypothetical protein
MSYRRSLLAALAVLCASAVLAPSALAGPPYAQTYPATNVELASAKVWGDVGAVDDGTPSSPVQWYFQYGKTTDYGRATTTQDAVPGHAVSSTLENLEPNTTYNYRVVAVSGGHTAYGANETFTTRNPDPDGDGFNSEGPGANDVCPSEPGVEDGYPGKGCPASPDVDGDGFPKDGPNFDNCPNQSGPAAGPHNLRGCPPPPDTDNDGFIGSDDNCPAQAGVAQGQYNQQGCPAPGDSDGDGIIDPEDPCPAQSGGAAGPYNQRGCPPPGDRDGDGRHDLEDLCPDEAAGPDGPDNQPGCPPPGDSDGDGFPDYFGPPNGDECRDQPGPAANQHNGNRRGCPERDDDGDGVPDHRDACPVSDIVNGSKVADARGCPPFSIGASIDRGNAPAVKAFIKSGMSHNIFFGEGPRVVGKPFVRMKATMSMTAAMAKKLKLKSAVIDSWSGQTPKASEDPEGGGRYLFPKFEVPAALKKKLAKLKLIPVTIKYVATDAYDKKHSYTGTATIGGTGCKWPKNVSKCPTFKKDK